MTHMVTAMRNIQEHSNFITYEKIHLLFKNNVKNNETAERNKTWLHD
jgi:hypothetical protein